MLSPRASAQSFASRVATSVKDGVNYKEMSDEQLRTTLEEAMRTNRTLTLENEVFERYLRRRDPQCLQRTSAGNLAIHPELPQITESARQAQRIAGLHVSQLRSSSRVGSTASFASSMGYEKTASMVSMSSGLGGTRTTSASQRLSFGVSAALPKQSTKGPKITVRHRIELVDKEVEDMKKQYEKFERAMTRKKEGIKAQLEVMKYRMAESMEAVAQFETEVLGHADPVTNKVPAEKLVRFMEEQLKVAGSIIDKCNLGLVTSNRLIGETRKHIARREDVGNTLRPIDFEQLTIENDYLIDENEKNGIILKGLKRISGHYNLMSKYRKQNLIERKSQLQSIEKELILKKRENVDLRRTQIRARLELEKALGQLNYIKELQEEYEIPDVLDFLDTQRQLQEARKNIKRLNRQRNLQVLKLKRCRMFNRQK